MYLFLLSLFLTTSAFAETTTCNSDQLWNEANRIVSHDVPFAMGQSYSARLSKNKFWLRVIVNDIDGHSDSNTQVATENTQLFRIHFSIYETLSGFEDIACRCVEDHHGHHTHCDFPVIEKNSEKKDLHFRVDDLTQTPHVNLTEDPQLASFLAGTLVTPLHLVADQLLIAKKDELDHGTAHTQCNGQDYDVRAGKIYFHHSNEMKFHESLYPNVVDAVSILCFGGTVIAKQSYEHMSKVWAWSPKLNNWILLGNGHIQKYKDVLYITNGNTISYLVGSALNLKTRTKEDDETLYLNQDLPQHEFQSWVKLKQINGDLYLIKEDLSVEKFFLH